MPARIVSLTAKQTARLPQIRDELIKVGLNCDPADFDSAETAMRELYRLQGLEQPKMVLRLSSPMAAELALNLLSTLSGKEVFVTQVAEQVAEQVVVQVAEQVRVQIRDLIWHQLRDQVAEQVVVQVAEQVMEQVVEQVADQVVVQVAEQVRVQVAAYQPPLRHFGTWCLGSMDSFWNGYYTAYREFGVLLEPKLAAALDAHLTITNSCGWWYPYREVLILTDRPSVIHRDERGRLHSETGPAIQYRDGYALYAWHGVRLDPAKALAILGGEIPVAQILKEPNAEVKRVMIACAGWDRVLMESKASIVDTYDDQFGRPVTLYRLSIGERQDAMLLHMLNSTPEPDGSHKPYTLRVPPTTQSAREGMAWTFGMNADQYAPAVES